MRKLSTNLGIFSIVLFLTINLSTYAQKTVFPGKHWKHVKDVSELGYDASKLKKARDFSETIKTSAVVIVQNGLIVDEWGEVDKKYMTHSIRKSFLSAMYGEYVLNGTIDLDKKMIEIGIDDVPPLSDVENKATIRDCLKARSGIYHDALYESQSMKDKKPARHTEKPGAHWYYNNWDFNAAGTIFEKFTGKKIFEALKESIADPIGMEDFEIEDGEYVTGEASIHPAYPFIITAHDCARFGLLMLNRGNWDGKQVIDAGWVDESTRYHSDASLYFSDGYGYMWWVSRKFNKYPHLPNVDVPEGTYSARGSGGHFIVVIPEYNMVVVHRVDTFVRDKVSKDDFGTLLNLILEARK